MNRQIRSLMAAALALVVVLTLLGCETQQAAPATSTAPATTASSTTPTKAPQAQSAAPIATTAAPETIKVGISASLTGPASRSGTANDRFMRMGIDDVNAKGGIKVAGKSYRFEAVTADNKMTSEGGAEAGNRLVLSEKVRVLVSGASSAGGAQQLTESNKVLLIVPGALDAQLGPKLPYTLGAGYPSTRMRIPALYGQLVKAHPDAKRVAVVYDDSVSGRPVAALSQDAAKSNGLTVVATEYYPVDLKDFGPLVTRVLSQNPDAIDFAGGGLPAAFLAFTKALNEQGYHKTLFGVSGSPTTLLPAGPAADGFFFQGIADYSATSSVAAAEKDLIQRYITAYGEAGLETTTMGAYSIFPVLAQAMAKANTVDDTAKIADTLRAGQWDTQWGKKGFSGGKTFGSVSFLDMNLYLSKVEGGKLITFDSFNATLP